MGFIKPLNVHRKRSHLETRLALREEHVYLKRTLQVSVPVYLSFAILDAIVSTSRGFLFFLALRMLAIVISCGFFVSLRGRSRYVTRALFSVFPVTAAVQFIMISENLTFSPYFCGFALVLIACQLQFHLKGYQALLVCTIAILPTLTWYTLHWPDSATNYFLVVVMSFGSALVTANFSDELNVELTEKFQAQEAVARESGRRLKVIDQKVREILRRQTFENQFSPQVIKAVLENPASLLTMHNRPVVLLVIDIVNSTSKASSLESSAYKKVIEEVFDVFTSACLKWNITIDKFTGDGAQAFAGAPISSKDDLIRSLNAALETQQMLSARKGTLSALWGEDVEVRTVLVNGIALVGFIGRGRLKSFTAVGDAVSLAHRLCARIEPGKIGLYPGNDAARFWAAGKSAQLEERSVEDLKGYGGKEIHFFQIDPLLQADDSSDLGRCQLCGTPRVLVQLEQGIFDVFCPSCQAEMVANSAA